MTSIFFKHHFKVESGKADCVVNPNGTIRNGSGCEDFSSFLQKVHAKTGKDIPPLHLQRTEGATKSHWYVDNQDNKYDTPDGAIIRAGIHVVRQLGLENNANKQVFADWESQPEGHTLQEVVDNLSGVIATTGHDIVNTVGDVLHNITYHEGGDL